MNGRASQIGFSQRIRLEWLEQTTNLVLAGNDKAAVNDSLQELLKDKVSVGGQAIRGNREKIITILMKIWFTVPRGLEALRDEGLQLHQGLPRKERIAVHWGMALAVYPFWGAVAAHTGRLLRLQGTAAAAHVQRRVKEQYGERETAARAARRVLRSFIDWNVLKETDDKGVYAQGNRYSIQDHRLISWLVEASLRSRANGSAAIKDLLDGPSIFPFRLARVSAERLVSLSPRMDLLRHGLDEDLVMLHKMGVASKKGCHK
ncbi:MAG: hypothetical protein H8E10_03900 [Desulfobacterales bacterium]|nr:hypothetical protein [Desulfobacterales bacterium]